MAIASVVPVSQAWRIRTVLWKETQSAEFRRQHWSSFEVAMKLHVGPETVRKWIHQGELSAVRVSQGRLFVDRAGGVRQDSPEAEHEDEEAGPQTPADDGTKTAKGRWLGRDQRPRHK